MSTPRDAFPRSTVPPPMEPLSDCAFADTAERNTNVRIINGVF
jgi:hypothetical protein